MTSAFEITEMSCAYSDMPKKVVLHIKHLAVPKGEIVYFVGPSGIGKSTILEVMGMMNNTICKGCSTFNYMGENMLEWWKLSDEQQSQFRREKFSFIFQNNNLMNNFNAWENVKLTALFQGMTEEKVEEQKKKIFDSIDIPIGAAENDVRKLSGGQRQRLAFARAILPQFDVLFGDEPTGNLDPDTAQNLMVLLRDVLKKRNNATAIIVSHDINLATNFADRIVQFQKIGEGDDAYGQIDDNSIYFREGDYWKDSTGQSYTKDKLKGKLYKKGDFNE